MTNNLIFADESGTDNNHRCYTIGAIKLNSNTFDRINEKYDELYSKHKIIGEIKWTKVGDSIGMANFCLDIFDYIIRDKIEIGFIVVKKDCFNKWQQNPETGFYTTYNLLLTHILKIANGEYEIYIDDRDDTYKKQDEVIEIISNRMLLKSVSDSNIKKVNKSNSKQLKPIQIIDLITGAINVSTNNYLDPKKKMNSGKIELIKRLSRKIGWDSLCYDTFPNNLINIWHFPYKEFRAVPSTKKIEISE